MERYNVEREHKDEGVDGEGAGGRGVIIMTAW